MTTTFRRFAAVPLFLFGFACAKPGSPAGAPARDPNLITHEQLLEHRFASAYDAVQALRSNWLVTRGTDSFRTPSLVQVYFDNVRLGGIETLRAVTIGSINYIRHFDGLAATERWGIDHGAGVIYVSTHPADPAVRR